MSPVECVNGKSDLDQTGNNEKGDIKSPFFMLQLLQSRLNFQE